MAHVIQPHPVILNSTSIVANTEPEWSAATAYGLNALVQVTTATPHRVYKCLRNNNINRPPASHLEPIVIATNSTSSVAVGNGSKTFTVPAGLGFVVGDVVKISKTQTPNAINMTGEVTNYTGTTLTVLVYRTVGEGTHASWAIQTENEIGFWEEVGATNQWRMFDGKKHTKSVRLDSITCELEIERTDYVAFFGLVGRSVTLRLRDESGATLLWEGFVDLAYAAPIVSQISDWWEYFFGEYIPAEDVAVRIGIAPFFGRLEIIIQAADATANAECGNVIIGRAYRIGQTQYGARARLVDWPEYQAKRMEITTFLRPIEFDPVYRRLAMLQGITTAWIGVEDYDGYEAYTLLGKFVDMHLTASSPGACWATIDIEG